MGFRFSLNPLANQKYRIMYGTTERNHVTQQLRRGLTYPLPKTMLLGDTHGPHMRSSV